MKMAATNVTPRSWNPPHGEIRLPRDCSHWLFSLSTPALRIRVSSSDESV